MLCLDLQMLKIPLFFTRLRLSEVCRANAENKTGSLSPKRFRKRHHITAEGTFRFSADGKCGAQKLEEAVYDLFTLQRAVRCTIKHTLLDTLLSIWPSSATRRSADGVCKLLINP